MKSVVGILANKVRESSLYLGGGRERGVKLNSFDIHRV